jgi:hypothetical protein
MEHLRDIIHKPDCSALLPMLKFAMSAKDGCATVLAPVTDSLALYVDTTD